MQDAALSKVTRKVVLNFTRCRFSAEISATLTWTCRNLCARGMGWNRNFYNESSVCEYSQTHVLEDFAQRI